MDTGCWVTAATVVSAYKDFKSTSASELFLVTILFTSLVSTTGFQTIHSALWMALMLDLLLPQHPGNQTDKWCQEWGNLGLDQKAVMH